MKHTCIFYNFNVSRSSLAIHHLPVMQNIFETHSSISSLIKE